MRNVVLVLGILALVALFCGTGTAAEISTDVLDTTLSSGYAEYNVISVTDATEQSAAGQIGLNTWLIFFILSIGLLILSFCKFQDGAADFLGYAGFVISSLCLIAVPWIGHTEYVSNLVTTETFTVIEKTTEIQVLDANWFLYGAALLVFVLSLLNAFRIAWDRAETAGHGSSDKRAEHRKARRAELTSFRPYDDED